MSAPTVSCSWAPWWSPQQRRSFLDHVEAVLKTRFGTYNLDEVNGTVLVEKMDCVLGLSNLAQTCRSADPEEWRLIIYSHVARLDDFSPDRLTSLLESYDQLQPHLRVRVVSNHHLCHVDAVRDPLPLDLSACLSVDLDGAACPVDRSFFKTWGVEHADVMATALANTLLDTPLTSDEPNELPDSCRIFTGDSLFTSGHLLDFERNVPDIGEMGAVVTVPAAHTLLVCPLELTEQFVEDSAAMLAASYIRFLAGPNSVSPNALWWRPGHELAGFACFDNQRIELVAPEWLRTQLWDSRNRK